MLSKADLSNYCLRGVFLSLSVAGMLQAQSRITCSSDNGRRTVCPANTRGGVRLINQISSSRCVQGRTWGYDNRGVWVDQSCRAEFALGGGGGVPGRPMPSQGMRPPRTQVVSCSSDDGRRNTCSIPRNGQVRLIKQRSGSPCHRGSTWGTQAGVLWVDRGCRADFEVSMR